MVLNAKPFQFSSNAIIAQCGNIAFDASTFEIWGALLNGATLVVIPYETVIDSEALATFLRVEKITDAWFTVALFNQLVMENPGVFGSLNNVLTGGDALNPKMIHAVLCSDTPPCALWNGYGPTENTVFTTLHRITLEDSIRSSIPIGVPIAGTQCYVLDAERQPVPPRRRGGALYQWHRVGDGISEQARKNHRSIFA
ncbi:AMP-binding protein [Yokenella regensburgei]|uniref:AMP-binding protein n=1 Tax=Yokenella regensburgei TaxID=158877 RepID=UPI003ED91555